MWMPGPQAEIDRHRRLFLWDPYLLPGQVSEKGFEVNPIV